MTVPRMFRCPLATLALFALVTSLYGGALHGQAASPPSQPPADWGAVSINLEDVPYPHPVQFLDRNPVLAVRSGGAGDGAVIAGLIIGDLTSFDLMEALRVPPLILYGEDEPGASIGGDAIAEAIPSAQRITIPATGHFPFVEQPEAFLDTVRAFLAR